MASGHLADVADEKSWIEAKRQLKLTMWEKPHSVQWQTFYLSEDIKVV